LDANSVALAVGPDDEVWIALHSARIVVGFNSGTQTWDRILSVPVAGDQLTRLAWSAPGELAVNGIQSGSTSALAVVNVTTGGIVSLMENVLTFGVIANGQLAYVDTSNRVARQGVSDAQPTFLGSDVPLVPSVGLTVDSLGGIWLSIQTVGVEKVDGQTGSASYYLLPQVPLPTRRGGLACGEPPCNPNEPTITDPQIQAIVVDSNRNLWITTSVPGPGGDPGSTTTMAPLYELSGAI
jgi:hypothetical protein